MKGKSMRQWLNRIAWGLYCATRNDIREDERRVEGSELKINIVVENEGKLDILLNKARKLAAIQKRIRMV